MTTPGRPARAEWRLDRRDEHLERWRQIDQPSPAVDEAVRRWMNTRRRDPYEGARRETAVDNLWWVEVPGTAAHDRVVVCSYFIFEADRRVQFTSLTYVTQPVTGSM